MNCLRLPKLLLLFLLCSITAAAQQKIITGKVLDTDGKPVHGATIGIKGTTTNIATAEDGSFTITVPSNESVLKISNVWLLYQDITIGTTTSVNIKMQKDNKALDDVIVVGYGTQRKSHLTGSVGTIDMKKVED